MQDQVLSGGGGLMRAHICHVIESLEFGGAEKVVVDLANAASGHYRVSVCCLKREGELRQNLAGAVEVFCLQKAEGNDFGLPVRLARELRARQVDLVHTHNWGTFIEGTLAARVCGVPAIHTVHGSYAPCAPGMRAYIKRRLRHTAERLVAHLCRRIIAVSHSIAREMPRQIGISVARIATIHNGIDVDTASRSHQASSLLQLITVGRLAPVKNHAMMLPALAQAPAARLTVVGDGPERAALEALAQSLGLGTRVQFLGFRTDIRALLAQADAFILASHYEGISIAILEAMRAGLPIIATAVGGVPETVIDSVTGILVADNDVAAMAMAIRNLGHVQRRQAMGDAGYELLRREFSLDATFNAYDALYRRYLARPLRTVQAS